MLQNLNFTGRLSPAHELLLRLEPSLRSLPHLRQLFRAHMHARAVATASSQPAPANPAAADADTSLIPAPTDVEVDDDSEWVVLCRHDFTHTLHVLARSVVEAEHARQQSRLSTALQMHDSLHRQLFTAEQQRLALRAQLTRYTRALLERVDTATLDTSYVLTAQLMNLRQLIAGRAAPPARDSSGGVVEGIEHARVRRAESTLASLRSMYGARVRSLRAQLQQVTSRQTFSQTEQEVTARVEAEVADTQRELWERVTDSSGKLTSQSLRRLLASYQHQASAFPDVSQDRATEHSAAARPSTAHATALDARIAKTQSLKQDLLALTVKQERESKQSEHEFMHKIGPLDEQLKQFSALRQRLNSALVCYG